MLVKNHHETMFVKLAAGSGSSLEEETGDHIVYIVTGSMDERVERPSWSGALHRLKRTGVGLRGHRQVGSSRVHAFPRKSTRAT
mmetsp:Transcript_3238/g.5973  ORF Transcript_3238/g.5973 Transcript_3238/m.5973 type:complete len:84 (-) Transcript_3238:157-408(-)